MAHTAHALTVSLDPRFTRILEQQRQLQAFLFPNGVDETDAKLAEYIRNQTLALGMEVGELLEETHWKPWAKKPDTEPVIPSKARYTSEMADVIIFAMNLMLAGEVTSTELFAAIEAKQTKNMQRWLNGYDGKSEKCPRCKKASDDTGVTCRPHNTLDGAWWCGTAGADVNIDGDQLP